MKFKFFILSFVLIFVSCSKHVRTEKKLQKLDHINKYDANFSQQKSDVLLNVKKFSADDCRYFFGVNVINCGYQPIQLTVNNFSDSVVYLSPTNISLPLVSPKKVAKKCHWKTGEIMLGVGIIASIFYWPALIPTVYSGYEMKDSNIEISKKIIQNDIIHYMDNISILPLENVSRIIFVSAHNFSNNFLVSLFSQKHGNLEFKVQFN